MCKRHRPSNDLLHWICLLVMLPVLAVAPPARACSGNFPNSLLEGDQAVLGAPSADFLYELQQIAPPEKCAFRYINKSTNEAELEDLQHALSGAPDAQRLLAAYKRSREQFETSAAEQGPAAMNGGQHAARSLDNSIPSGLPEEFLRYLRGAIAYHNGKATRAINAWKTILDLPADRRRARSVWATFMIARTLMAEKPDEANRYFEQTRQLVQRGFSDSLGLASLSYGWQGRMALDQKNYKLAIRYYLMHLASGDPLAAWSLRDTASALFTAGPTALKEAADDLHTRRVVTAYLVAGPSMNYGNSPFKTNQILQWLAAVETSKTEPLESADRLAWIAYQHNLYPEAKRWLNRAEPTPLGHWVRAKLLLQSGELSAAAAHLAEAERGFPRNLQWRDNYNGNVDFIEIRPVAQIRGELGVVHLAQQNYIDALDDLLRGGFWEDAAYLAERVLSADELMEYVDANWPVANLESATLRSVLARRLMRLDRGDEAMPYFDPALRQKALAYHLALCDGRATGRSPAERAESLWKAASIARGDGIDLLGTELEPDGAIYGGSFPTYLVNMRIRPRIPSNLPPSPDEIDRVRRSGTTPELRFHYRYLAADLAWEAIALMPDNDTTGAERLCEAGGWIKNEQPKSADRFYKELVTRFRQTRLADAAARKRWFPK